MKILIVDDDITHLELVSSMIKEIGHEFIIAKNFEEAIKIYNEINVSLVLIDLVLTNSDGFTVVQKMNDIDQKNKNIENTYYRYWIPKIFLSSKCDDQCIKKGYDVGADDYIFKPITKTRLQTKIIAIKKILDMQNKLIELKVLNEQSKKAKSLEVLSSGIAHEIRNPLATLIHSCQNLARRLDPSLTANVKHADDLNINMQSIYDYSKTRGIFKFIDDMKIAGNRISSVINGLLTLTNNLDAGIKEADCNELVKNAIGYVEADSNLKRQLNLDQVNLELNLGEGLPKIKCHPQDTIQAIIQLIRNALFGLHESKKDDLKLTISTYREDNNLVKLTITDNGCGIDKNNIDKIYDPFFTTKDVGDGMGLGLTIAHGVLVMKDSGKLEIESEKGQGTVVMVSFPCMD